MNRREFLKASLAAAGALAFSRFVEGKDITKPEYPGGPVYLPVVINRGGGGSKFGKVVHVHSAAATNWDFNASTYYGRTQITGVRGVNQAVVDEMVDRGLTELVGLPPSQISQAWEQIIPDYTPGKLVAIKINLNNSTSCSSMTTSIDAIAQPVNAVVRGLTLRGVREPDIVVFDAIRRFPERLDQELLYHSIQFFDSAGCQGNFTSFSSNDPNSRVVFSPPSGSVGIVRLADILINASYLINMPIMKGHSLAGVTLGFKNHFGSTNNPSGMHNFVSTSYPQINIYNALVDLNSNPHIAAKTVLVIGDGIYGSRGHMASPPARWSTFGNQAPCSLFFARDPVAIDCVMHDLLKAEKGDGLPSTSHYYLVLAGAAGLGIYEAGDPWSNPYGSGYSRIAYSRIEI